MPQLSSGLDWILALLGFGFVIFIHELGHFLFAKWAGVKVLRFSIGFGPALWNRRIGETDYCISVLPFGGYVKMLGEDDAADPDSPPEPRSFLAASRGWRALILVGGVLFNLVSSYLILLGLAWRGMPLTPPEVGAVVPELSQGSDSPAKRLGLHAFDRIVVVNGVPVRSFDEVRMQVALAGVHAVRLEVERRGGDGKPTRVALPQGGGEITPAHDGGMPSLGILPPSGNRVQEVASLSGELGSGDPKPGDRILAIDGEEIPLGWKGWTGQRIDARLRRALGADVRLRLERGGQAIDTTIRYGGRTPGTGLAFGLPVRVERVLDGSPAARAGLRAGDFIVAVGDERIGSTEQFIDAVRERGGRGDKVPLTVLRDDQELPITVAPEDQGEAMIGAEVADKLIGRLPYLPAALGAERSALAAAGVAAGDCIVVPRSAAADRRDARDVKAKGISCLVLTGGDPSPLELSDADYKALFDGKNPPGARLIGTQVAAAGNLPKLADGYGSGLDIAWPVDLSEDGRASFATLQAGDWIVDTTFSGDQSPLRAGRHALEVVHNVRGKPQVKAIDPTGHGTTLTFGFDEPPYALERWSDAFPLVNGVAKAMIWGSLQLIPRFFIRADKGGIDATRSLTGPIGIFSELKARSQWLGFASYLKLVALIGLNLFLVNLLPIPIVDGGQLLFLGIEAVMRRPLPAAVRNVATWIGFAIVVSLMLFVLSLDLLRKAGLIGAG